jgi:NAD(P)H-hydrate epimerase
MPRYLTHREMRVLDLNSEYLGVPPSELMENAGRGVVEILEGRRPVRGRKVAVLCGLGNNGGDGLVAARYLAEAGAEVEVILVEGEEGIRTPEARKNLDALKRMGGIPLRPLEERSEALKGADVVLDALLGTGVKGPVREPYRTLVSEINALDAYTVSVDVPSGLDVETGEGESVRADLVVTFHGLKRGLEGFETVVRDIGIPPEAESHVGPGDLKVLVGRRVADTHKGDHGRVLILGGSREYYGAPILSALGALHSGADLVTLLVPEGNFEVTRSYLPDFLVGRYPAPFFHRKALEPALELAERCDAVVVGPGLGTAEETREALLEFLLSCPCPTVIDADGLKALRGEERILREKGALLTPHTGEYESLTGGTLPEDREERREALLAQARAYGATILLKSSTDVIASPDGRWRWNETGNPGMTVGGTGDVLAGLAGGFLSQALDPFEAACCAAYLNGAAGDALYESMGYAFTASELAAELPFTLKALLDLFPEKE